ncbi:MAG: DUF1611 domain-containing protein, partial [bacterium]
MTHQESRRIVIMAEGKFSPARAKTATGVIRYGPYKVLGVIDSTKAGKRVSDFIAGIGHDIPIIASLDEALDKKPEALLIGIAPMGGKLPDAWRAVILQAIRNGMDIISGLHTFLSEDGEFVAEAQLHSVEIWDVRKPPKGLPVAQCALRRAKSYILTTVGSDCSVGKMTTAIEIVAAARRAGITAEFVATGQTGIMISGWGYPLDAITADFVAGAIEKAILEIDGKFDLIVVEGQGSLLHPGY